MNPLYPYYKNKRIVSKDINFLDSVEVLTRLFK